MAPAETITDCAPEQAPKEPTPAGEPRAASGGPLGRISAAVARVETVVAALLCGATFALLLLNVVTRAAGVPFLWVDELAVFTMVWMAFFGASVGLHHRGHIAVTMLPEALPPRHRPWALLAVDGVMLAFSATLAVLVWLWFDPITALTAESLEAFSQIDFNFIYEEPTVTLGVRKIFAWLVLPVFCLTTLLHGLYNAAESIAEIRRGSVR